jgi:hypothetical protein
MNNLSCIVQINSLPIF